MDEADKRGWGAGPGARGRVRRAGCAGPGAQGRVRGVGWPWHALLTLVDTTSCACHRDDDFEMRYKRTLAVVTPMELDPRALKFKYLNHNGATYAGGRRLVPPLPPCSRSPSID